MSTAEEKARHRARKKASGGKQISAMLNGEEAALLDAIKKKHPELSQKEVLIAGLRELQKRAVPTNAELLKMIEARLK